MNKILSGSAMLLMTTAPVLAGGIERAPQSLAVLFEQGNYAELSFGGVDPTVEGTDIAGFATGDVAFGDRVLDTVIGRTVKFPDASVAGIPITEFAPEHAAAQAYLRLARELVARGAVA